MLDISTLRRYCETLVVQGDILIKPTEVNNETRALADSVLISIFR